MIEIELKTITKHPSICYNCSRARKHASEELQSKGYVGCVLRELGKDWDSIIEGEEVAEGWVDMRARVFGESSGIITNLQLITKEIKKCRMFEVKS